MSRPAAGRGTRTTAAGERQPAAGGARTSRRRDRERNVDQYGPLQALETLLPAFVWLLGTQAWRAFAADFAASPPSAARLTAALALFLPALLAGPLARNHSPRRVAATAALVLALARFVTATVGPSAADTYGWIGVACVAAYLTVWPACARLRRQAGHSVMLGISFQLIDILLTGTLDTAWRPGWWPTLAGWAAALPTIWLALRSWRLGGGEPPDSPLALAMPAVFFVSVHGLTHLARLALALGWSVPTTGLAIGLGVLLGLLLTGLTDQFLKSGPGQRGGRGVVRSMFRAWHITLLVVPVLGLSGLLPWLGGVALALAPTTVAVNLGVLLRSRPIGLPRRIRIVLPFLAWSLALAFMLSAGAYLWPVALAVVLLFSMATVALLNQGRIDPDLEYVEYWTWLTYLALLFCCLWSVSTQSRVAAASASLPDTGLRVAAVLIGPDMRTNAARLTAVRSFGADLVLVQDEAAPASSSAAERFVQPVWWLTHAMGLHAYEAREGLPALLGHAPAVTIAQRPGLALAGSWQLSDNLSLAAASLSTPQGQGGGLASVSASLGAAHYWLLASPNDPTTPLPLGYHSANTPYSPIALSVSPSVTIQSAAEPLPGLVCATVLLRR